MGDAGWRSPIFHKGQRKVALRHRAGAKRRAGRRLLGLGPGKGATPRPKNRVREPKRALA
jgi:hypothetical protein